MSYSPAAATGRSGLLASSLILLVAAGCASTPRAATPSMAYVVRGETTQSESSVISCAKSSRQASVASVSAARLGRSTLRDRNGALVRAAVDEEVTAYGNGTTSNSVSFRTSRLGDRTTLTVSASSVLFPASGRGRHNTNKIDIPPTHEAKAMADALLVTCVAE